MGHASYRESRWRILADGEQGVGWVDPFGFTQDRLSDTHQSTPDYLAMGIALLNPSYSPLPKFSPVH